ncbi:MAG: hypothetical protein COU32_01275 [Candidatus Magasanikbacteria bacterium CG10_big_fil_rev_8_21_14_0_10_42_10]|uniref:Uncharacterized protein n=2 Tax=Candidatus Magasanikiibacteriota TaxID=1752731 RepID=A0A2H0TYW9_9BACT|nr:MAG: hypothetical protein COU32_01275 [Candidatus Magasanikbacteria bacterium CG10_big_fil_rev_8_21_14_0_10_42_10]PIZ92879.1 MAG: hypothetical protein COX82_03810 [Candidatus Magasanikbacteria bacterium CG_4_10_14_0_2_um_filter_41_10]
MRALYFRMADAPIRKEETEAGLTPVPAFDARKDAPMATPERRPSQEQQQSKEMREPQENISIDTQQEEGFLDETIEALRTKLGRQKKQKPTKIPQVRDEITVKVEKIMEEGIADAFKELGPIERQEFKIKGEETALQIRELLKATHVKIKKIFRLLFEWLKMLPGINRFFLEQEAKIKADKIMSLQEQYYSKEK